jgi:glyoxylate/hydroxypyruvate reductase
MRCVLVSSTLDLRGYFGPELAQISHQIEVVDHVADGPTTDIRLAVAWHPPANAFERYPGLQAVCSIGAGVDNIVACPSLRPDVEVIRVVDPAQAQMMAGFVAWHVIGHQRNFAAYGAQQRDRIWQRRNQRSPQEVPVGILGQGAIGQKVAADLA